MRASVVLMLSVAGCAGSPAERRIRQYFALPAETPDDTATLRAAILRRLPPGTPAESLRAFLVNHGVGRDGMSAYHPAGPGDTAIVRVEYDRHGWNIVETSYRVRLAFDSSARLSDVRVARWATGP